MVIWVIESVHQAPGHLSVTLHVHAIILILVSLSMTQNLEAKNRFVALHHIHSQAFATFLCGQAPGQSRWISVYS
jgi:hypothetical protein